MSGFLSQLGPGTWPQWATLLAMLTILTGCVTVWIKGIPERFRARTERDQIAGDQYAEQIAEFRKEVHACHEKVESVSERLNRAESASHQRGDKIANMAFIIRLLISELRRLDPKSIIVGQAEALMAQMTSGDAKPEAKDAG